MSKLMKLKQWLTVSDTARHLSLAFEERVTEADVLQLGIDGQLKLSINFVNAIKVRPGKIVSIDAATFREVPDLNGNPIRLYEGPRIFTNEKQTHVVELEKNILTLSGVYDLPMIGAERLHIERLFQRLTNGPEITALSTDGAFIDAGSGTIYQIQEDSEMEVSLIGSKARQDRFREAVGEHGIPENWRDLYRKQAEERAEFLDRRSNQEEYQRYFPAGYLPEDHVIVIRTSALQEFLKSADESNAAIENKPIETRERGTLLTIIAALCRDAGYDFSKHAKTAGLIQSTAATMGCSIGETTIENHLKKIPDALAARMK